MAAYLIANTTRLSGPNYTTSRDVTPAAALPDQRTGPGRTSSVSRGDVGGVVAGSLALGLLAAVLLAAHPFISPQENGVTGAVL